MSETLRDLVVSLSLQTDNFTRNIKSVNTQIKEAESAFKLAASGVTNFEQTTGGLAAKQTTLTRQLNLQKVAVDQYQKALEAAKKKLAECQANQATFEAKLASAKGAGQSAAALKKLEGQVTATKKATQNAADAVSSTSTKLNNAQAAVRNTQAALNACNGSIASMRSGWAQSAQVLERNQSTIAMLGLRMRTVQSEFTLATAGIKNTSESTTALTAKLKMLDSELNIQQATIRRYEESLAAAKTQLKAAQKENDPQKIRQARTAVEENTASLNNARAAYVTTQQAIRETNQALTLASSGYYTAGAAIKTNETAVASLGKQIQLAESKFRLAGAGIANFGAKAAGTAAKLQLLKEKQTLLRQQVQQLRDAVKSAEEQLKAAQASGDPQKIQQAKDKLTELNTTLNNTEAQLRDTTRELNLQSSAWTRAGAALTSFSTKARAVSSTMVSTGRTMTRWITTPLLGIATASVNAEIQFEKTFATVRKTVRGTEEDYTRLEAASKKMSTQLAAGTDEINTVMSTAGQLGIATENIESFTKTMIDLGNSTTDLDANTAATEIAKFINIMGTSQKDIDRLGASLAYVGNRYATTEAPIMEMAMRIAGAGKQVGMTEAQVIGVATALSSVGIEAQMGGSAFSKALIKMELAAETGGQSLTDFATVSGMTAEEFKNLWKADPTAAFIAFTKGIAQMDDEGISAIATLQDLGFKEVRLRDTMLRTVSNTRLMEDAVADATRGWQENTALTEMAGKIYATTAAQLTNLKNKASLAGQQIASDLTPTIQNLMSSASDLLDKFMGLDEEQRLSIIKWGAVAAAMGPALLILGRLVGAVGSVAGALGKGMTAIGKFSAAVKGAGGGVSGLLKVVGSSKLAMVGLTAAVIYGAYKLYDYASGAKAAREALEGMNKTAQNWKNTAADTFYSSGKGLDFFGLNAEDFQKTAAKTTSTVQDWMDGMVEVWSDGKYETDAIVKEWQDSSDALSKDTRAHMVELRDQAQASGDTAKAQEINAAIAELDALDKRIRVNLNYFQGKTLTDKNKAFWQGLMDQKQAILLKWGFAEEPEGGTEAYDTIAKKVRAAEARAAAMGQEVDSSLYQEATLAASQGYAAVLQQMNDQYDAEYEKIIQLNDATERQNQLDALNEKYKSQRTAAAKEYLQATDGYMAHVLDEKDMRNTENQLNRLHELLAKLAETSETDTQGRANILTQLNELTGEMDEGTLTEYMTLLTQVASQVALLKSSGMSDAEIQALFPDVDIANITQMLDLYAEIGQYLSDFKNIADIQPLNEMYNGAISEEVLKIATDLNLDGAKAAWEAFAANPGAAITTNAQVTSWTLGDEAQKQTAIVTATVGKYVEIPEGASKEELTPSGVVAYVSAYNDLRGDKKADMSLLKPEVAEAFVKAYREVEGKADVTKLTPDEIVAQVMKYVELPEGTDKEALKPACEAFVLAYSDPDATTDGLKVKALTGMMIAYANAAGVNPSLFLTSNLQGVVRKFAVAMGVDEAELLAALKREVEITGYNVDPTLNVQIPGTIYLTGYDYMAYKDFMDENGDVPIAGRIRLGSLTEAEWESALGQNRVKYWKDGVEVDVSVAEAAGVDEKTLALITMNEDGTKTYNVIIAAQVTGTEEAIDAVSALVDEEKKIDPTPLGMAAGILPATTMDLIDSAMKRIQSYQKTKDWSGWDKFWARILHGESTDLGVLNTSMSLDFNQGTVAELSTYIGEIVAAIQQGENVSAEDLENLKTIFDFLNGLQETGTGTHILAGAAEGMTAGGIDTSVDTLIANLGTVIQGAEAKFQESGEQIAAGIGEGQKNYDFSTDAETTIANDEAALNDAAVIHSPSQRMKPIGGFISAGVGAGMTEYDFSGDAAATVANLESAISAAFMTSSLRSVGLNAMFGMAAGVRAGQSAVISAMRSAAQNAVAAAKSALQIHSPSRVFRDEVGVMTMKGFGQGVLQETKEQAQIIRNASRYLTTEAGSSAVAATNDNRKTYNTDNSTSFSFAGATFQIRSEQDVRDLAVEIATLTRRNQRGRGLRMA
jgi:TP901 family phage tail tape measure protein